MTDSKARLILCDLLAEETRLALKAIDKGRQRIARIHSEHREALIVGIAKLGAEKIGGGK